MSCAALVAVAAVAQDVDVQAKLDAFKVGETTKAEVTAALGHPAVENDSLPDGHSSMVYQFAPKDSSGNPPTKPVMVVILFDRDEKLVRVRYYGQRNPSPAPTSPTAPSDTPH
jgi:hypothetical protein